MELLPPPGKPPTGFSESDVGISPGIECDVGRITDEATSYDIGAAGFTDAKICHGCKLDMERNRPPDWDIGKYSQMAGHRYGKAYRSVQSPQVRDVSISWLRGQIHNAKEETFGNDEVKQKDLDRLQFDVGELCSNKLLRSRSSTDPPWQYLMECDATAVNDFTGPPLNRRDKCWYFDQGWQNYFLPMPISASCPPSFGRSCLTMWESIVVKSVRLILQRWSRVNSFSSTICCASESGSTKLCIAYTQEKISQPTG